MIDRTLTLSMLGGLEADATGLPISARDRKALVDAMQRAAALAKLAPYDLGERLLGFVGEALRHPVAGVLGEVWSQRKELREIAEQGKDKRDVEGKVDLFDHAMSCSLHPSVEVHVNGAKLGKMTFDCKVDLELHALQLVIRNAWITRIQAGQLVSTVSLEYESIPLMPPCNKTVDLNRSFDLPRGGIRLGGEKTAPVH